MKIISHSPLRVRAHYCHLNVHHPHQWSVRIKCSVHGKKQLTNYDCTSTAFSCCSPCPCFRLAYETWNVGYQQVRSWIASDFFRTCVVSIWERELRGKGRFPRG
ncbi:hypothetical protein NPIL_288181 [Nephila pilipes]|uniref:Uncharacterized protein n=1 Tax=Nephila pilipes TaxID=299642 RepID=A0A8X6QPG2_NEPPI|nr:hypothetical protein NPIL_288181 [Nephila pilipes]